MDSLIFFANKQHVFHIFIFHIFYMFTMDIER